MLPGQLTAGGQSDGVLRSWGAGEKGPMPRVKNNSLQRLFLDCLAEGSRTHSNGQTTAREWHSLRLLDEQYRSRVGWLACRKRNPNSDHRIDSWVSAYPKILRPEINFLCCSTVGKGILHSAHFLRYWYEQEKD